MTQAAPQENHWKDRAITASAAISDAFDVFKAYGAHIANWVLFFCLVANLIEVVSPTFEALVGLEVIAVQSISLDIAGFGLTAMAASAKSRGDNKSALKASIMGWTLISVMAVTVGLVTLAAFKPDWSSNIAQANQILMFVRVIVTVFYGHIVHQIREEGVAHENRLAALETEVSTLQGQLQAKQKEVDAGQLNLSTVQSQVSTLEVELDTTQRNLSTVQRKLDAEQQRANSFEQELLTGQGDTAGMRRDLNAAAIEVESVRGRLAAKVREVEEMQADLSSVVALRRELNAAQVASQELRTQLDGKTRELQGIQGQLSTEQRTVSSLRRELSSVQSQQVSTGQRERVSSGQKNGANGQPQRGDTGQEKVVQLDSRRTTNGREYALAVQQLLKEPGMTGREIARRLGGSPTTANEWKKFFEDGKKLEDVFPDLRVANE